MYKDTHIHTPQHIYSFKIVSYIYLFKYSLFVYKFFSHTSQLLKPSNTQILTEK